MTSKSYKNVWTICWFLFFFLFTYMGVSITFVMTYESMYFLVMENENPPPLFPDLTFFLFSFLFLGGYVLVHWFDLLFCFWVSEIFKINPNCFKLWEWYCHLQTMVKIIHRPWASSFIWLSSILFPALCCRHVNLVLHDWYLGLAFPGNVLVLE